MIKYYLTEETQEIYSCILKLDTTTDIIIKYWIHKEDLWKLGDRPEEEVLEVFDEHIDREMSEKEVLDLLFLEMI